MPGDFHSNGVTDVGRRPRVLLAEDDDEIRWALKELLHDMGWAVQEAPHGRALLEMITASFFEARELPPEIIVTDVRMPGFNGFNIIDGLRDIGWTTPVVIISAYGDPETRARVSKWPAAVFFDKPVDLQKLERTMRWMLVRQAFQ